MLQPPPYFVTCTICCLGESSKDFKHTCSQPAGLVKEALGTADDHVAARARQQHRGHATGLPDFFRPEHQTDLFIFTPSHVTTYATNIYGVDSFVFVSQRQQLKRRCWYCCIQYKQKIFAFHLRYANKKIFGTSVCTFPGLRGELLYYYWTFTH